MMGEAVKSGWIGNYGNIYVEIMYYANKYV